MAAAHFTPSSLLSIDYYYVPCRMRSRMTGIWPRYCKEEEEDSVHDREREREVEETANNLSKRNMIKVADCLQMNE